MDRKCRLTYDKISSSKCFVFPARVKEATILGNNGKYIDSEIFIISATLKIFPDPSDVSEKGYFLNSATMFPSVILKPGESLVIIY